MQRFVKWAGLTVAGVVGVAAFAAAGAFAASEVVIRMPPPKPAVTLVAAADAGAVRRGRHIATVQGCNDCHGANLQGKLVDEIPGVVTLIAPNLTRVAAKASDADLDRAIRHGVGTDGRPLWVMPSSAFAHLTDGEAADLVAYLRSVEPAGAAQPRLKVGPLGRLGVLLGQFKSEPALIAAHENPALPDLGARVTEGRALARACVECHGPDLKGATAPLKTPDLMIAAAYDPEDFERLLRTGVAAGDRKVGLMSEIAPVRFNALTSQEIAALQAYLKARADKVIAQGASPLPTP